MVMLVAGVETNCGCVSAPLRFEKTMPSDDPYQNPFQSMPQPAKPETPPVYTLPGPPSPRHARLGFFDCFFEAKDFLGRDYWLFWGLVFVGMFIAGVVPFVLQGPMYCGIGLCFIAKERGQQPTFDLLFKGFEHFMNTLIPVLIYSLLLILIVPLYVGGLIGGMLLLVSGEEVGIILGPCVFLLGVVALIAGSTFMSYGYMFSSFLVADYKLEGMDAFRVSLEGIQKNFFGLLGVMIATTILAFGTMLLCYIPFFLIIPLITCGPFMCYRKIFRPPNQPKHLQKFPPPN